MFIFIIIGKIIKKAKEGTIINKILLDKLTTFKESLVSQYNQINARKEVRGIEANNPARSDDLLAISDIATMVKAEISVFIIK